jgi:hypothetical protein
MNADQMERAAYIAAHRLLTTDLSAPELACPGARRSAVLDNMARIIKSVYEAHTQRFDEATDWWPTAPERGVVLRPRAELTDARPGSRTVIAMVKP